MTMIKEPYAPPDKQIYTRGKSQYSPYIEYLMSGKPGELAIECTSISVAKGLCHALSRYLQQQGLYDTFRPRFRKDSVTCCKVWVVTHNKEY
jgi:hypothetical protein